GGGGGRDLGVGGRGVRESGSVGGRADEARTGGGLVERHVGGEGLLPVALVAHGRGQDEGSVLAAADLRVQFGDDELTLVLRCVEQVGHGQLADVGEALAVAGAGAHLADNRDEDGGEDADDGDDGEQL